MNILPILLALICAPASASFPDFLIRRNKSLPVVQHYLFTTQSARLAVHEKAQDSAYQDLVELAISRVPRRPGELPGLVETFILLRDEYGLLSELAGFITALAYDLAPQVD